MKYQTARSFEMALVHHLQSRRSATDATWNPETWTWIPARASIRDLT